MMLTSPAMIRYFIQDEHDVHDLQAYLDHPVKSCKSCLSRSLVPGTVRLVLRSTARHGIASAAPWLGFLRATVETSRWQAASVHGLFQNSRDLLRKRPVLGSRTAPKRFLQVVRNICAYENAFAISHLSALLLS